jgi:hypothetical protein
MMGMDYNIATMQAPRIADNGLLHITAKAVYRDYTDE